MPRIFDNIEDKLLPVLQETIALSDRADFCVSYFNLRGWKALDSSIERWSGGGDENMKCNLGGRIEWANSVGFSVSRKISLLSGRAALTP
jgi:hypothetical protein